MGDKKAGFYRNLRCRNVFEKTCVLGKVPDGVAYLRENVIQRSSQKRKKTAFRAAFFLLILIKN